MKSISLDSRVAPSCIEKATFPQFKNNRTSGLNGYINTVVVSIFPCSFGISCVKLYCYN